MGSVRGEGSEGEMGEGGKTNVPIVRKAEDEDDNKHEKEIEMTKSTSLSSAPWSCFLLVC